MVKLYYKRGEVIGEAEVPKMEDVLKEVAGGTKKSQEAAAQLGISQEEVKQRISQMRKSQDTTGYGNNVQKMISFRGTVRAMTVMAKNRKGGQYPLRVINLYMKPNTERYYEENLVNPISKDSIRRGSESEGYHPKSARWNEEKEGPATARHKLRNKAKLRRKLIVSKKLRKCACKRNK